MMWMMAPQILPSAKFIGGRLLNDAAGKVELKMDKLFHGKSIGLVSSNNFADYVNNI
jgi:hypothetical protein